MSARERGMLQRTFTEALAAFIFGWNRNASFVEGESGGHLGPAEPLSAVPLTTVPFRGTSALRYSLMRKGTGTILASAALQRKFTGERSGGHLSLLYTNVVDLQEALLPFQYSC